MAEMKRMTAIKTNINTIISGRYVSQEGFNPNYILTANGRRISRVRLLGTIVKKYISDDKKFGSLTIDDGTATLRAKTFGGSLLFSEIKEDDIVDVIGKIREYQGEIYVIAEAMNKITDPNWILLRTLEIKEQAESWRNIQKKVLELQKQTSDIKELKATAKKSGIDPEAVEDVLVAYQEIPMDRKETPETREIKKEVLKLVKKLDKGKGADYSEIVEKSSYSEEDVSSVINELLADGQCFEPRPGKIKKL